MIMLRRTLQIYNNSKLDNNLIKEKINKQQKHLCKLNDKKSGIYTKLDKQVHKAMSKCKNDMDSLHCQIIWKNVYDSLNEIDKINNEINMYKLYIVESLIENEYLDI